MSNLTSEFEDETTQMSSSSSNLSADLNDLPESLNDVLDIPPLESVLPSSLPSLSTAPSLPSLSSSSSLSLPSLSTAPSPSIYTTSTTLLASLPSLTPTTSTATLPSLESIESSSSSLSSLTLPLIIAASTQFRDLDNIKEIEIPSYEWFLTDAKTNAGALLDQNKIRMFIDNYERLQDDNISNVFKFLEKVKDVLSQFEKSESVKYESKEEDKEGKEEKKSGISKKIKGKKNEDKERKVQKSTGPRPLELRPGFIPIEFEYEIEIHMPIIVFIRRKGYPDPFFVACMDFVDTKAREGGVFKSMRDCYLLGNYQPSWVNSKKLLDNPDDRATLIYYWLRKIRADKDHNYKSLNRCFKYGFGGRFMFTPGGATIEPNSRCFLYQTDTPTRTNSRSSRLTKEQKTRLNKKQLKELMLRLRNYSVNEKCKWVSHAPNEDLDDEQINELVTRYGLEEVWAEDRKSVYGNFYPRGNDALYRDNRIYVSESYCKEVDESDGKVYKRIMRIRKHINTFILELLNSGCSIKGIYLCTYQNDDDVDIDPIDIVYHPDVPIRSLEDWDSKSRKKSSNNEKSKPKKKLKESIGREGIQVKKSKSYFAT